MKLLPYWIIFLLIHPRAFGQQVEVIRISPVDAGMNNIPMVEPVIAVDPENPDNIVTAAIAVEHPFSDNWTDSWKIHLMVSRTNGQSWRNIDLPGISELIMSGDPWLDWSDEGTVYLSILGVAEEEEGGERTDVLIYRSRNGGLDWEGPYHGFPGLRSVDHPVLDLYTERNTTTATVFATSEPFGSISAAQATDSDSFFRSLPSFHPDSMNNNLGSGVALSDSQLVFSYFNMTVPLPAPLWAVYTHDRGTTYNRTRITQEHIPSGFPMMALDRSESSRRNRIYSVWTRSNEHPHIMSAYSDDAGQSWSTPVRVHEDLSIANRVMPNAAVNSSGVLMVTWVDSRNHEGGCWDIYGAASLDGGETYLPEVRITRDLSCPEFEHNGGAAGRWRWGGDYRGITTDRSDSFYAVWAGTRSGVYQIRMAKISIHDN